MPSFYHVDLFGELEIGDNLELYWPPQMNPNEFVLPPDGTMNPNQDLDFLEEEFPEGLSTHGARHALCTLVVENEIRLPDKYQAMVGSLFRAESQNGDYEEILYPPAPVLFETGIELVRRIDFENQQSRFQSYFGCRTPEAANRYRENYRNGNGDILEVECHNFEFRDMNLLEENNFIQILENGRKYWRGVAGSDNPTWEVVMEPPVEVVSRVSI